MSRIIIGTNKSEADLALAQNLEVISEVWNILQVDAKPEWVSYTIVQSVQFQYLIMFSYLQCLDLSCPNPILD